MTKEKYALLDTDFISKTHLIHKDENNRLIDRIMEMPGYSSIVINRSKRSLTDIILVIRLYGWKKKYHQGLYSVLTTMRSLMS